MVKILLIQLDRFGDNLFIVPLIKGIKNSYPDSHITVLVREELKEILERYREVDSIMIAEWLNLPAGMMGLDETEIILNGYTKLKNWIQILRSAGFDRIFNLNFNKITTLITSSMNVHDAVGFTVGSDGARAINGLWANYMGCVVQTRQYNPFHIVDVYRNFEQGLPVEDMSGFMIDKSSEEYASWLFKEEGIGFSGPVIAFQPGASNRRRVWPKEKFSNLAGLLLEMGRKVIILGTSAEKDIALKIKTDNPGVIDLTGRTTFPQLAAILKKCEVLISNDTGTVHLASAVGTRVIGLYMCHAYPIETGPYGRGHITISPTLECFPCKWREECSYEYKCREFILPEDVLSIIEWILVPDKALSCIQPDIEVNISLFDEDGFISYIPLVKRPLKLEDVLRLIYKGVWKDMSDTRNKHHISNAEIHWLREGYGIINIEYMVENLERIVSVVKHIESLADKGVSRTDELLCNIFLPDKRDMNFIQDGMEDLNNIDSDILHSAGDYEAVSPLIIFFQMQKNNIQGSNPVQILRDSGDVYRLLKLHSSRFCNLTAEFMVSVFQTEILCSPSV